MLIISCLLFVISIFLSGFPKVLKVPKYSVVEEGTRPPPRDEQLKLKSASNSRSNGEAVSKSKSKEKVQPGSKPMAISGKRLCSIEEEADPDKAPPESNGRPSLRNFPAAIKRLLLNRKESLKLLTSF